MISILCILGVLYLLVLAYLYFNQEGMIFQPEVLAKDYKFSFPGDFEEVKIPVEDNVNLSGLLFKAEKSRGLLFYLHGNGGSVKGWGDIAQTYTDMGYDIFILDYRGYGKSDAKITGETQFFDDVKKAYAFLLKSYAEKEVIIMGYSIGTGPAAMLASVNHPKALVLQAPYYSLKETVGTIVPFVPGFIKKYKFETYKYLRNINAPVCIFHGKDDRLLPYSNAEKLQKEFKKGDVLIALPGQGHNGINDNELFKTEFKKFTDSL